MVRARVTNQSGLRRGGRQYEPGDVLEVAVDVAIESRYLEPVECPVEKSDGETCGRERPCRYHDD
ncbi:hypothetical protein [Natrarchaeobaculum sulfurireducens]|uniref:Uncharacterized protein n=1 Tax=Natrarchaeobaculum sulfurireducens TaxID=2044521 RepID=A0A346PHJ4_9EURY|nr:hypothetical protein [Natrarchaeobaculum sulfurireducens]AXR78989.1 hypothetical protein AArc1_2676 [Natrarchaeobaculum sulfurireducens]